MGANVSSKRHQHQNEGQICNVMINGDKDLSMSIIPREMNIFDLKTKITFFTKIPQHRQQIFTASGYQCDDGAMLTDYNIRDGTSLRLKVKE